MKYADNLILCINLIVTVDFKVISFTLNTDVRILHIIKRIRGLMGWIKAMCPQGSVLMNASLSYLIRWSLKMSLQSLMAHTAWMECGSSATPLSLCPNTGATASCLLSSVSPLPCFGASYLPASPSATSGLWFPASKVV